ncbi:NAD(P)-dependent oxidoreductase [Pseudomonas sp. S1Bt23]|uniref:NAD(P)-dependent oxidoreductase n=1 Tax=Pseudomonas sp. S1Bt23 TaxID=3095074 RepID=UPI002A59CEBE|nr:NAD(P)-dependent oxidoreductase [Pseudomonas sp. S1Bt23]WPO49097.1 NAD(P)-dependent oxidoreductase [Pseudomonas sp. S1Bt23]
MTEIFLTHAPGVRANYYAEQPLRQLQALGNVRLNDSPDPLSLEQLVDRAQGCSIIVASREAAAPAELFERLPQLAAICRVAVDIRNIDVEAASRHGVLVTHATPGFDRSVSEWVIGVMIDLARGISRAAADYWQGRAPQVLMGRELRGATLGIIGYGFIGKRLADIARLLQMRVWVNDPNARVDEPGVEQVSFEQAVGGADYVVCLAPAVERTYNLFGREAFRAMRPGAFFINASRGELVDDAALLEALEQGLIGGCALDVGRAPDQMPGPLLAAHPKVIASPHIGGLTPEASEHQAMDTVRQVQALLAGRVPQGAVNLARADRARDLFRLQSH